MRILFLTLLYFLSLQNYIYAQDNPHLVKPSPFEIAQTQMNLDYWLRIMLQDYQYSWQETAVVCGLTEDEVKEKATQFNIDLNQNKATDTWKVLPYPGGRHPRIGFLDGAINPIRATKAGVFIPGTTNTYAVIDLPEAIFDHRGLIFLAHTHIPTIWENGEKLNFIDWNRDRAGHLSQAWGLPDGVAFGASIQPEDDSVNMELWLHNNSDETLSNIRTQVCIMLKHIDSMKMLSNDNKIFGEHVAAVQSKDGWWLLTSWTPVNRTWGNPDVPCIHVDPSLPDCPPGETVYASGKIWRYSGDDIKTEIQQAEQQY